MLCTACVIHFFSKRFYAGGEVKTKPIPYAGSSKVRSQPIRSKLGLNLYLKSKPSAGQTSSTQSSQTPPVPPTPSPSPSPATTPTATPSTKETDLPDVVCHLEQ
eukprot:Phypoly_transcript_07570.p2 GENE.Phypoly_transcript_07570~~Phypoly_transcript_07570.p2  ORF type:complete len:104 (+),score=21.76 Phypoly_transcript_07570:684-995(+)